MLKASARALHNNIKYRKDVSQKNDTHLALRDLKICSLFIEKLALATDSYNCLFSAVLINMEFELPVFFAWIAQW